MTGPLDFANGVRNGPNCLVIVAPLGLGFGELCARPGRSPDHYIEGQGYNCSLPLIILNKIIITYSRVLDVAFTRIV